MFGKDPDSGAKLQSHAQVTGESTLVNVEANSGSASRLLHLSTCNRAFGAVALQTAVAVRVTHGVRFSVAFDNKLSKLNAQLVVRHNGVPVDRVGDSTFNGVRVVISAARDVVTLHLGDSGERIDVRAKVFTHVDRPKAFTANNPGRVHFVQVGVTAGSRALCGRSTGQCGCVGGHAFCRADGSAGPWWSGGAARWSTAQNSAFQARAAKMAPAQQGQQSVFDQDGIGCASAQAQPVEGVERLFAACPAAARQRANSQCPKGLWRESCLVAAGLTCQDFAIETLRDTAAIHSGSEWGGTGQAPAVLEQLSPQRQELAHRATTARAAQR